MPLCLFDCSCAPSSLLIRRPHARKRPIKRQSACRCRLDFTHQSRASLHGFCPLCNTRRFAPGAKLCVQDSASVAADVESCKMTAENRRLSYPHAQLASRLPDLRRLDIGSMAQEDKKTDDLKPADPDTGESTVEEATLGLLPNPFEKQGVKCAVTYIGEVLGNPTGGAKQSAVYEDRFNFAADVDFEKLLGLKQLTFHANIFQIDGGGLSRGALLNYLDVSGIEALPTTRLYEIWFEQKWGTKLALRAGQLAADTEFMTAKYTDVFTNASLGWPAGLSLNMPSGGPSPPLAAMGPRLRADLTEHFTLIGAVFDGNAAGPGSNDPQLRDRYGLNFRVNDPPLALGEMQFLWHAEKGDPGLAGKFKLGGWRHFGDFTDERLSASGGSLASVAPDGISASLSGDFGVYSVFEQKLYRVGQDADRGIGIFARASYSPPDRNLIDLYADAGIEWVGLSDQRPHDKFGVAAGYARIS